MALVAPIVRADGSGSPPRHGIDGRDRHGPLILTVLNQHHPANRMSLAALRIALVQTIAIVMRRKVPRAAEKQPENQKYGSECEPETKVGGSHSTKPKLKKTEKTVRNHTGMKMPP